MYKNLFNLLKNFEGKSICISIYGFCGALKLYDDVNIDQTDEYIIVGNLINSDYIWLKKNDILEVEEEYDNIVIYGIDGMINIELI